MSAVSQAPRSSGVLAGIYLGLLAVAVGLFFLIQHVGEGLSAPPASGVPSNLGGANAPPLDVEHHVLATLVAIVAGGAVLSLLFRRLRQPVVIAEVIAGIVLGPSVLGEFAPGAMHWLIPGPEEDPGRLVLTSLKMIAQLGVALYMFLVGLELNPSKVGRYAHAAIAISHASIVLPFVLGAGLALWLYPRLSSSDVPFTSFALFLGVAMSITAFPVLARILTDQKLDQTDLGAIALSCAATDDVTAWCLLAFVVGVAQSQVSGAFLISVSSVVFIVAMFVVVRPLMARLAAMVEPRGLDRATTPLLLIGVLLAGLATHLIGIHSIFGAFLLGVIIPHDSRLCRELVAKLQDVVTILFLPAFFAVTGMNTRIGLIQGAENWLMCLAIIVVATIGKFGGSLAAARFSGLDWRTSAALGVLMNTRGLMELIVLNIGLSLGVISPTLFAMMVLMALATTLATAPLMEWLQPSRSSL